MPITPPAFQKDAVPSLKGWHHPKTNELLKSQRISQSEIDEFNGVAVEPEVEEEIIIDTTNDIPDELEAMTKRELEAYARENLDVELDRRSSRKKLLDQVSELIRK